MTLLFLSILALTIIYFYLTRKFKWVEVVNGNSPASVLYYNNYQATVSELELGGSHLTITVAPAKVIYVKLDNTLSVRRAKRIAEDKILEFEQTINNN